MQNESDFKWGHSAKCKIPRMLADAEPKQKEVLLDLYARGVGNPSFSQTPSVMWTTYLRRSSDGRELRRLLPYVMLTRLKEVSVDTPLSAHPYYEWVASGGRKGDVPKGVDWDLLCASSIRVLVWRMIASAACSAECNRGISEPARDSENG